MKYLDPKADLTFKKVFGKHPDLLISLLNALLPLEEDEQIQQIEYLTNELVPDLYLHKNSIVDVLCKDICGRTFCVEMQMEWSTAFKQRVLFNASKLYVNQAEQGAKYSELRPVYSLNLVNEIFEPDTTEFIHNYRVVHDKYSNKVIEGLRFTFIELPKFSPHSITEKRMAVLWLRFLTEINADTSDAPADLLDDPSISKALEELRTSTFSREELYAYDKFWDGVRVERTLLDDSFEEGRTEGLEEGMRKGMRKGMQKGIEKGEKDAKEKMALKLLSLGVPVDTVSQASGLSRDEIEELANK